ncbi:MAG: ATP-binding protein, partial [bacterium]|nr:ATP-binding protein [bacterium]
MPDVLMQAMEPLRLKLDRLGADLEQRMVFRAEAHCVRLRNAARQVQVLVDALYEKDEGAGLSLLEVRHSRAELAEWILRLVRDEEDALFPPEVGALFDEQNGTGFGESLPPVVYVPIESDLLHAQEGEKGGRRWRKRFRRWRYAGQRLRTRAGNLGRWILRKEPGEVRQPERGVPVADLCEYYTTAVLPFWILDEIHWFARLDTAALQGLERIWQVALQVHQGFLQRQTEGDQKLLGSGVVRPDIAGLLERSLLEVTELAEDARRAFPATVQAVQQAALHAASLAGTSELPRWKYRPLKAAKIARRGSRRFQRVRETFVEWVNGFRGGLKLAGQLVCLQSGIRQLGDELGGRIEREIEGDLRAPILAAAGRCRAAAQEAHSMFDAAERARAGGTTGDVGSQDNLLVELEGLETRLANFIHQETIEAVQLANDKRLATLPEEMYQAALENLAGSLLETCTVISGEVPAWQAGQELPEVKVVQMPVQRVVRPYLESEIAGGLERAVGRHREVYGVVLEKLQDLWKVARFNIESSIAELESAPDASGTGSTTQAMRTARDLVGGGLIRVAARVDDVLVELDRVGSDVAAEMSSLLAGVGRKMGVELRQTEAMDVRIQLLRREARSRAKGYARIGRDYGRAIVGGGWKYVKVLYDLVSGKILFVRRFLGLASVERQETHTAIDEANLYGVLSESLPQVYRRLFRQAPLQSEDLLIAREKEMETFRRALERWKEGRRAAVSVVGELGSGKTSLLNCAVQGVFKESRVIMWKLEQTTHTEDSLTRSLAEAFGFPEASLAELEKKVLQFEEPRVFILEHAHHLFLRTIGGFEGLRAFLLFLAATSERVLWVLSMNEYTWRYLDPIVHISDYFPFQIETTNMSGPELEKTIMARHGLSGYRLRFRKGEALSRTLGRQLKKAPGEREEQAVLRKAFFEKLNSVSKGNVQIGLFYWLRSIENLDGDIMEIAPLEPLRFDFLSHLSVDKLFTLAAIVLHGTL